MKRSRRRFLGHHVDHEYLPARPGLRPMILAAIIIAKNPAQYGFDIAPHSPMPTENVTLPAGWISAASRNGGRRRGRHPAAQPRAAPLDHTDSGRQLRAAGPAGTASKIEEGFQAAAPSQLNALQWHTVKSGESLATIARKLRVSRSDLAEANYLKTNSRSTGSAARGAHVLPCWPRAAAAGALPLQRCPWPPQPKAKRSRRAYACVPATRCRPSHGAMAPRWSNSRPGTTSGSASASARAWSSRRRGRQRAAVATVSGALSRRPHAQRLRRPACRTLAFLRDGSCPGGAGRIGRNSASRAEAPALQPAGACWRAWRARRWSASTPAPCTSRSTSVSAFPGSCWWPAGHVGEGEPGSRARGDPELGIRVPSAPHRDQPRACGRSQGGCVLRPADRARRARGERWSPPATSATSSSSASLRSTAPFTPLAVSCRLPWQPARLARWRSSCRTATPRRPRWSKVRRCRCGRWPRPSRSSTCRAISGRRRRPRPLLRRRGTCAGLADCAAGVRAPRS